MWSKSKSILNAHPKSIHTKFELDCVNTVSDNGRKPPFSPNFQSFLANRGPKLGQRGHKSELVLNTYPIGVYTKFELDCMNDFSDNRQKPPFSVISFWPLEGQNLANVAQNLFNSEHSPNKCTHQV